MAGKPKKRIDYAGWSVDIFSTDVKIDKLLDAQGWIGFGVYFYLCQMAFGSEGYFYEWCYDLCATTARKMGGGVGAGTVKETVDYCLQIGLFDKRLFDRWGVLTSKGIQRSYLLVLKSKNRKGTEIIVEYWLLDKSECEDYQDVVFVRKNSQSLGENGNSLEVNTDSLEENGNLLGQKESKGKESIVNKRKVIKDICTELDEPAPTSNIRIPLNDKNFYDVPVQKISEWKDTFPAVCVEEQLKRMIAWCNANPSRKKTRRGVERFIVNWLTREQDRGARYSNSAHGKDNLEEWANGEN